VLASARAEARPGRSRRFPLSHFETEETIVKGAQKPKKLQKKQAQKTLKERRNEKRAAAKNKFGSS
jgi:hypothetical protein